MQAIARDLYHHSELDKNQQGEHGDRGYMTNREAKNKAKQCEQMFQEEGKDGANMRGWGLQSGGSTFPSQGAGLSWAWLSLLVTRAVEEKVTRNVLPPDLVPANPRHGL